MENYRNKFGEIGKYKNKKVIGIRQEELDDIVKDNYDIFYWVITDKSCNHFPFGLGAYELGNMTPSGGLDLRDTPIFLGKKEKKVAETKKEVFVEDENEKLLNDLLYGKNDAVESLLLLGSQ